MRRVVLITTALAVVAGSAVAGYRYYWLHRYDSVIARTAPSYDLDPELVRAVIFHESYFNTHALSPAGARGLMQVTDPVVLEWRHEGAYRSLPKSLERRVARATDSTEELLADPEINVHVGCWYLGKLIHRYGEEPEPLLVALAAYNAGSGNAERWLGACGIASGDARAGAFVDAIDFPETRRYVIDIRDDYRGGNGWLASVYDYRDEDEVE